MISIKSLVSKFRSINWTVTLSALNLVALFLLASINFEYQRQLLATQHEQEKKLAEFTRQLQQTNVSLEYIEDTGDVVLRNIGPVEASEVGLAITTTNARAEQVDTDVIATSIGTYDTDVGGKIFIFNIGKMRSGEVFAVRLINAQQGTFQHPLDADTHLRAFCSNCPSVER